MPTPLIALESQADSAVVRVSGDWLLHNLASLASAPLPALPAGGMVLDGADLAALDTSGALRLLELMRDAGADPQQITRVNFSDAHAAVFELVARNFADTMITTPPTRGGMLTHIGRGSLAAWRHVCGTVNFVGVLSCHLLQLLRHPGAFRHKEFVAQIEAVFVNAIPLAFAMMFLMGVVFAYLLGIQAQQYGASIFVVDGVALAMSRELAPVIVAILVAGRSGAAMTAQIGSMKVNDEIDAISVLGLSPYTVLVVPRILALLIALPLLVFIGDVAGILGGMLVAERQLGIEASAFIARLDQVLPIKTAVLGLIKAPVFALFIGVIACRMGFTVARDAQSVGANTTSTVVQSIVAVIIINAMFAVAFVELGF
ncbi:ABC transporter permease [Sulfuriferula plumbiphila]|uniref:ABC transporter permease n=1 Tax=Sulfuriferula plumbiphila TaxID=171865 RepID=A0A512L3B9_9PROT|nr:ABC transporter permease [Sulfuriferula plumbiphila]BBP02681.1 ABC transporter permease [Sulfuriferula plumbiphila]GEP28975.1 ABC transporter permease [Sulfuriferula plumbiphila]